MATYSFSKRHLSLVSDLNDVKRENHPEKKLSKQLSLFDEAKPNLIFFMEKNILRGNDFDLLLHKYRPDVLFDIRIAPRLDFVAPSRALAFKIFQDIKLHYVDVLGSLGVHSYSSFHSAPEEWGGVIAEYLLSLRSRDQISFFVFDSQDMLNQSKFIIPAVLKKIIDGMIFNVEVIDGSSESLMVM